MKTHKFKTGSYVKYSHNAFRDKEPIKGCDFIVMGYDDEGWVLVGNVFNGHNNVSCNVYNDRGVRIDPYLLGEEYYFINQEWLEELTVHDVLEPTPEQKKETLKEMTKTNVVLLTNSNTIMVDQNF